MVALAAIVAWDTVCLPSPYLTLSLSLSLSLSIFSYLVVSLIWVSQRKTKENIR